MKTSFWQRSMNDKGVSLIELLVVAAVVGILAVALGFTYVGWVGAYKMEKATKDLYTDLMNARSLALTQNRMYFATLVDGNNYSVTPDTNDSTALDAGDVIMPSYPKRVQYAISWNGAAPVNRSISFDKRGVIGVVGTTPFPADPVITLATSADVDPDYNCIVISQTRINMGKRNLGTGVCDVK